MKTTSLSAVRGVLVTLLAALMAVTYSGTAGATAFDLTVTATAGTAEYADGAAQGSASYEVTVHNPTTAAEQVSPAIDTVVPDQATVTGITATVVDASGDEQQVTSGGPSGNGWIIDQTTVPAGGTLAYTVTVHFSYAGKPTGLTCKSGGGIQITAFVPVGSERGASAEACVDAPKHNGPATTTSSPTDSPSAEAKSAPQGSTDALAPQTSSDSPTSAPAKPTTTSSPAPAPQTSAAADDPVGRFGSWVNSDGLIYFTGWAYDPSDMSKAPTTMWTIDGKVVAYQAATLASPDLYPYGVYNRGVFGGLRAPNPGPHSLCMFVFNIGAGQDKLVQCLDVNVPNADPTGDIGAILLGNGDIYVGGYAYDPSNVYAQTAVWITDNGSVVGSFYANKPGMDLSAYGVPGAHGIDYRFGPTAYGTHNVCLYVHNIGWGNGTWPECVTITINPDAGRDNPRGDFGINHNQGAIGVSGWAYDPNQYGTSIQTMWTVDGNVAGYANANRPHSGVNAYLGVGGDHGVETRLPASVGWHTVCQYAINVGLGSTVVTKCINVQVVPPPSQCPPWADACVDMTNSLTWLQSNGQITYGPVRQIGGREGYRTRNGTWQVYWKHIDHRSSEFNNAPMPYAIFFDRVGIAFHVGDLYVPSHGCIHLSWEAAKVYWDNLQVGDTVYVWGSAPY